MLNSQPRNEAMYPVKGSELLLEIPLKIRVEVYNCFLSLNECKHIKQYQVYNDKQVRACKIKIKMSRVELRKKINHKYERFVSRFEQLALCPCIHRNEGLSLCTSHKIT